jgi:hypothetical protein
MVNLMTKMSTIPVKEQMQEYLAMHANSGGGLFKEGFRKGEDDIIVGGDGGDEVLNTRE